MSTTTPSTSRARVGLAVATALAAVVAVGCYKPVIDDGGFKCARTGKKCPDGLTCGYDGRCWQVPPQPPVDASDVADRNNDRTDAADAKPETMCALAVVTPICQDAPASGQACSPSCQTGCACGRCNVVGKAATCVAVGVGKLADTCKLGAADDCGPGLICLKEACGNGLARCYKHCTKSDQCGGSLCQIAINDASNVPTAFNVCDVAPQTCNPVSNMGCPSVSLNCYLTGSNNTICDCPANPTKPAKNGEDCKIYSDCDAGLVCVSSIVSGVAVSRCHFACEIASSTCPATSPRCVPVGANAKYGYCDL